LSPAPAARRRPSCTHGAPHTGGLRLNQSHPLPASPIMTSSRRPRCALSRKAIDPAQNADNQSLQPYSPGVNAAVEFSLRHKGDTNRQSRCGLTTRCSGLASLAAERMGWAALARCVVGAAAASKHHFSIVRTEHHRADSHAQLELALAALQGSKRDHFGPCQREQALASLSRRDLQGTPEHRGRGPEARMVFCPDPRIGYFRDHVQSRREQDLPRSNRALCLLWPWRLAFAAIQQPNTLTHGSGPASSITFPCSQEGRESEALLAVARASPFVVHANTNTQENHRHAQSGRCPTTHCSGLATSVALRAPSSASR
jgi:hypothetical protein